MSKEDPNDDKPNNEGNTSNINHCGVMISIIDTVNELYGGEDEGN